MFVTYVLFQVEGSGTSFNTDIESFVRRQQGAIEESISIKKKSDILLGGDNAYNKGDYDDKDMVKTKREGAGMTTRAATKEKEKSKETQGIWSSVMHAGSTIMSKVTGKNSNEETETDMINKEKERQETRNEVTFQKMCAEKRDEEIIVRFQVLLAADYGFNPEKDKVFIRGLDVTAKDSWMENGVEMHVQRKAPKGPGPMSGITRMVGFAALPKKTIGEKISYKYFVVKEDKGIYEDLFPENVHYGIWNRILYIPYNINTEFFDQVDDAIVMKNTHRLEYRKKATTCYLPSFKQIVRDRDFLRIKDMVEHTERLFVSHTTGISLSREDASIYHTDQPALRGYDKACQDIAGRLTKKLFEMLSDIVVQVESNNNQCEIARLVEASTFLALFYILCESKIHRFLPEISAQQLALLVTALRPMLYEKNKCLKLAAIEHMLNTPERRQDISESFEEGLNMIMKSKAFMDTPEYIVAVLPVVHFLRGAMSAITIAEAQRDQRKPRFWGFFKLSNPSLIAAIHRQSESSMLSASVFEDMKAWSTVDPLLTFSYLRCLRFDDFLTLLNNKDISDFWDLPVLLAAATVWLNEDSKFMTSMDKLSEAMKYCFLPQAEVMAEIKETLNFNEVNDLEVIMKQAMVATIKNCKSNQSLKSLYKVLEVFVVVYSLIFAYADKKKGDAALGPLKVILTMMLENIEKSNIAAKRLQTLSKRLSQLANILSPLEVNAPILLTTILLKLKEELHKTKKDDIVIEAYTELDLEKLHPHVMKMIEERALGAMDIPHNTSMINKVFERAKSIKSWLLGKENNSSLKYAALLERAMKSSVLKLDLTDKFEVLSFVLQSPAISRIVENDWLVDQFSTTGKLLLRDMMLSFGRSIREVVDGKAHVAMLQPLSKAGDQNTQARLDFHNQYYDKLPTSCGIYVLKLRRLELENYTKTTTEYVNFLQLLNERNNKSLQDGIDSFKTDAEIQSCSIASLWSPRELHSEEIHVNIPFISKRAQKIITTFMQYTPSQIFRNLYKKHSSSGES